MARRMAVHFWPALTVISVDDFLDEQVEFGRPGRGVGAEQRGVEAVLLGDEADAIRAATTGWVCSFIAVAAEPVKLTTSWPVRWSNRSPTPPTISCTAPGGSRPLSIITRNAASHR